MEISSIRPLVTQEVYCLFQKKGNGYNLMTSYVVFGLPGSGKGTLAQFLEQQSDIVQVCSGDLLRAEAKQNKELQHQLNHGIAVEDSFVTRLVISKLESLVKAKKRFTLDGFPHNEPQQKAIELLFADNPDLHVQFIIIDVEKETALKRMASRFSCIDCAKIFNSETRPPQESGKCDNCYGFLKQRVADVGQEANKRLNVYERNTKALVEYYRKISGTLIFDGNQSLEKSLENYKLRIPSLKS
jgi:adenylate kinase